MDTQYTRRFQKIEAVLDAWLPKTPDSPWIEKTFNSQEAAFAIGGFISPELVLSLTRPARDLLDRGGKRWRPLLMLLIAESLAGEGGAHVALPLTPLVEFPHNASLIHDDIEDNSDERRGKPALHILYGTDTAINGGAFMYFLPLACLSSWARDKKSGSISERLVNRIWSVWASHMRALHMGQAMDIAWHRDFDSLPGLDEYDLMCRLKTGSLARMAAILGVFCSGTSLSFSNEYLPAEFGPRKPGPEIDALHNLADIFGAAAEKLGVGFQILDDVKNLDTGVPGKKRGDDIVEGKKSLPVLLYLHRYPDKRMFVTRCFTAAKVSGISAPEVEEFIGVLERAGVLEEAREKAMDYIRECRKVFSATEVHGFKLRPEGRELLTGLIDMLG